MEYSKKGDTDWRKQGNRLHQWSRKSTNEQHIKAHMHGVAMIKIIALYGSLKS